MWVAPASEQPIIVVVQQKLGWIPSVLSFVQFLGLAYLSVYTFHRTRQDKIEESDRAIADKRRERRAVWFHKVVVDEALKKVPEFTEKTSCRLRELSKAYMRDKIDPNFQGDPEDQIREAIGEFQIGLSEVTTSLAARIRVLDIDLAKALLSNSDQYEAKVSNWLNGLITRQPFDKCESLPDVIAEGEVAILKLLCDSEFNEPTKATEIFKTVAS